MALETTVELNDFLSPSQAARLAGLSSVWLRELAQAGKIPHVKTPLGVIFCRSDVEELAAKRKENPPPRGRRLTLKPA